MNITTITTIETTCFVLMFHVVLQSNDVIIIIINIISIVNDNDNDNDNDNQGLSGLCL